MPRTVVAVREVRLYLASTSFRSEADRTAMLTFFAQGRAVYERLR